MNRASVKKIPTGPLPAVIPVVAGALIDPAGRLLLQQRGPTEHHAGLWEFAGGKIEAGETAVAALIRELDEELGIAIAPADCVPLTFATERRPDGSLLILLLFHVRRWTGVPRAVTAAAIRWVDAADAAELPLVPLDISLLTRARMLPPGDQRTP